jgi:hypothetical protein
MRRAIIRAAVVGVLGFLWTCLHWFAPAREWPFFGDFSRAFQALIVDNTGMPRLMAWATRSAILTFASYWIIRFAVRRPFALTSWHLPPDMRRLLLLALVVAFPFQVLLGLDDAVQQYYRRMFEEGGGWRILANAIAIACEHVWVEGVVLGLAIVPGVLAATDVARTGRLSRFGLGFPVDGPRTVNAWLGIPRAAWPAIIAQGAVYFLVHFKKAPSEVATSLPAGIAVGWLSLRTRSFAPAAILHLATGAVVLTTIALSRAAASP